MTTQIRTLIGLTLLVVLMGMSAGWAQENNENQAAAPAPEDVNLAAAKNGGRIVFVSSEFDETWKADNLIDGTVFAYDAATQRESGTYGWASKSPWELVQPIPGGGGPNLGVSRASEEVVIGFKDDQVKPIGRIVINPQTADPLFVGRGVRLFEVQVSTQTPQGPWRSIGRAEVPQKPDVTGNFNYSYNISPPVPARYIKVIFIANWGSDKYVSCGEIEVYPPGPEAPTVASAGFNNPLTPGAGGTPLTAADFLKFFMDMKPEERNRFIADLERLLNALKGGSSAASTSPPPKSNEGTGGSGK